MIFKKEKENSLEMWKRFGDKKLDYWWETVQKVQIETKKLPKRKLKKNNVIVEKHKQIKTECVPDVLL